MESKNSAEIFQELVKLDSALLDNKDSIMKVIEKLLEEKPDTQFDAVFAAKLKEKILAEATQEAVKEEISINGEIALSVEKDISSTQEVASENSIARKGRKFFEKVRTLFSNKVFLSGLSASMAAFILLAGWYIYDLRTGIPEVIAGNWSFEYRKIPYDVPSLDLTFSRDLDASTVVPANIKIYPAINGFPEVKNGNTLSFKLFEKMKIGERYTIEISPEIKSIYGVKFGKAQYYEFEAVSGAKVTRILPEGTGATIDKPVLAFFSVPMIPSTGLVKKDVLPCPLTITPQTEGECHWISSSVVEFRPKNAWIPSNEYSVKIAKVDGLMYPISEEKTIIFSTERLSYLAAASFEDSKVDMPDLYQEGQLRFFNPSKGIPIRFSSNIKKEELERHVSLYALPESAMPGKDLLNEQRVKIPFTIVSSGSSDISSVYRIFGSGDNSLKYQGKYLLEISAGVPSAYGNLSTETPTIEMVQSLPFVSNIIPQRKQYSFTGAEIDPLYLFGVYANGAQEYILPQSNGQIRLNFSEEVPLRNDLISVIWQGGESACNLAYDKNQITKPNGDVVSEDNKMALICTLQSSIPPGIQASLVVKKEFSKGLAADFVQKVTIAPNLSLDVESKLVSNTELCVYSTAPLSYESGAIHIIPSTPVRGIRRDGDAFWNPYTDSYDSSLHCPVKAGMISNIIEVRLAPKTQYSIGFTKPLKSIYGDEITEEKTYSLTSGDIQERDKYVFSPLSKNLAIVPKNVPLVTAFQTTNTDKLKIEVCEMDVMGYEKFVSNGNNSDFEPSCLSKTEKDVSVKNLFWNLSTSKFDIEADILGRPLSTPYTMVRTTVMGKMKSLFGKKDPDRETLNVFVRSDLALMLESAQNKKSIFATSFDGKTIRSDLSFEFYGTEDASGFKKLTGVSAKWNEKTKLYDIIDATKLFDRIGFGSVEYIVAHGSDNSFGIITATNDFVSNYDFGYISGQDSSEKDFAYIYTDRPIYRQGDTIDMKGLLRTFDPKGYRASKTKNATLQIVSDTWEVLKEIPVKIDNNSNFAQDFSIPKEAKPGRYRFQLSSTGKDANGVDVSGIPIYNDGYFYIEAYKKPVFKINAGIDKKSAYLGDTAKIQLSPTYYFGGKLVNTKYTYSIASQSYFFDAKDYSDYQFGEGYNRQDCLYWGQCNFRDQMSAPINGVIDNTGNSFINFDFPKNELDVNKEALGERIYTFNIDVTDPDTGKTVSDSVSSVLHTTNGYVGIKLPYWTNAKTGITGKGIILDSEATPKEDSATIEFIKREWKNVKKQGVDGAFYSEYGLETQSEYKTTVSSQKDGSFNIAYTPKSTGEYEVRATYTGKNGKTYVSSQIVYVDSEAYVGWNAGNNSVTDIVAEKSLLNVGEIASLTIKSPVKSGNMFVSIEKDDAILSTMIIPIDSYAPHISLPITEEYLPNIYVKAYIIGQDSGMQLPVYKRALSVLKVSTSSKKLNVDIKTDKINYLPGSPATVAVFVTDSLGHPVKGANGSLSIVDESVLALVGNPKKNPFAFFYDMKRYLGVETASSLAYLIEKLEVKNVGNGEKGGAGDSVKWGDAKKKRWVFKDTAYWQSDFTTDDQGKALVTIQSLPDNLTTWVIESIVSTSSDNKIGIGSVTVTANKSVMISENLPRFFRSWDTTVLAPVVFNHTGKESDFTVSLASNQLDIASSQETIHLKDGESRAVSFEVVPKSTGPSSSLEGVQISIQAKAQATGEEDTVQYTLPLENSVLYETVATTGRSDASSFDEKIDLTGIEKKLGSLSIHYGATPFAYLLDGMSFVSNYPYGCAEQKTSAVAPTIAMKQLMDSVGISYDLTAMKTKKYTDRYEGYKEISVADSLRDYAIAIASHQKPSGGIGYWQESSIADFGISSSVLTTLNSLDKIGIKTDVKLRNAIAEYLKTRFYAGSREDCGNIPKEYCQYTTEEKISAVEALVSNGISYEDATKMLNVLDKSKFTPIQKLVYARILAELQGKIDPTDKKNVFLSAEIQATLQDTLNKYLVYNPRGVFVSVQGSIGRTEATALFLEILSLSPNSLNDTPQIVDNVSRFLASEKKSDGGFGSTRDTAAVIRAITTYLLHDSTFAKTNMSTKAILNDAILSDTPIGKNELFNAFSKELSTESLPNNSIVHFERNGVGKLFYDISLKLAINGAQAWARDEGFLVETTYYDYAKYKEILEKKQEEWKSYERGDLEYDKLAYKQDPASYLSPITDFKVGQLVYAKIRIITPETRDKVAFEAMIPSGSELVNTNLATETQAKTEEKIFDREELRDDRYFAYKEVMEPGEYVTSYVLRMTHAGKYSVLPANAFEFDRSEVFGRSSGYEISVTK